MSPAHGTPNAYKRGCRCEACRSANTQRTREAREQRRLRLVGGQVSADQISHGRSAYTNWGCRCETCVSAHTRACRPFAIKWRKANPAKVSRPRATEEASRKSRERQQQSQSDTLGSATRHYQPWTMQELDLASRTDMSAQEVAVAIGRTFHAVRNMRKKLRPKTGAK